MPLKDITVKSAKEKYNGISLDDDIMLFSEFGNMKLPDESKRMQCILVGLCKQGTAQYSVDTVTHNINPGDVFLVGHGQVVGDYKLSNDFHGAGIIMSYDFYAESVKSVHDISSVFLYSRSHPVTSLSDKEVDIFMDYFKLLITKLGEINHHFRRELINQLISAMLYDLGDIIYRVQHGNERNNTRAEIIFNDFIKLVEQNFRHERRVGWYARKLNITSKYLSETVKQVSKRTPNSWIDDYVTREIRVMLKNSTKSIKEIAEALHFSNQSFFGRYFKENTGMSPSKYRRS